jgi:hypothetical protein
MTYNVLKSVDLTNFVNVLMRFLVNCSNGGGQVSPVRTVAFRRILLSFSFSVQGHVEVAIILNLWRYDLVKP